LGYIDSVKSEVAKVALGGNATKSGGKKSGYFIEPTIFTGVSPIMEIMREEIFGPVVVIATFKTEEEVIKLANDTTYGLAEGIHTKDYERALRVTSAL
jgi:aldehyde dehydrogenase (NAD+)